MTQTTSQQMLDRWLDGQMAGWTDGWMDGQRKLTEDVTKKETAEWKQMEIFIFKSGVEVEHILYFKFN